jgi:hypothetical protein
MPNEVNPTIFILFYRDTPKLFAADSSSNKFVVDDSVVYRNETVRFEKEKELVEKVIGVLLNKPEEILYIVVVQESNLTCEGFPLTDNIPGFVPELQDVVESAFAEATAADNV